MKIDPNHPRAASLKIREQLVWGVEHGLTSQAGLIAHGRGEAFDYLLGEKTHPFAQQAITAASASLLLAKHPVLSVNGNTAALVADDLIRLAEAADATVEVNLFHYTAERVRKIEHYLRHRAQTIAPAAEARILSHAHARTVTLPHIASSRKITLHEGIAAADVVFVPLEDGDRAQALIGMGKTVIAIDLNPLSRTAQTATITIVDNVSRAVALLQEAIESEKQKKSHDLQKMINEYDNKTILSDAVQRIKMI